MNMGRGFGSQEKRIYSLNRESTVAGRETMKNEKLEILERCLEPEGLHVECFQSQAQAKVSLLWEAKHTGDMTALVPLFH